MKSMMLCLAVFAVACAVEPVAPKAPDLDALELAVQAAAEDLSVAILNKDAKLLAKTMAPQFLAEFEAYGAERDAKLLSFIEQQEEGYVMAYGYETPKVVSVERGQYGTLLVELRDHAGAKAFNENVRLKKVHFWEDGNGRAYFAGLKALEPTPAAGVVRQAELIQYSNFDVANNSGVTHYWFNSSRTTSAQYPDCFSCAGQAANALCTAVNVNYGGGLPRAITAGQAWGFSENANCGGPGSCAMRIVMTPYNSNTYCRCDGSGGATINGVAAVCTYGCCFQSAFSSDFWWNSGDNNSVSWPSCQSGTCPN